MFVCHDPPIDGIRYLLADLSVTCFSGAHLSTAAGAVAVLAGYALGFPAVVVAVFRGRHQALLNHWRESMAFMGGVYLCSKEIACPYPSPYFLPPPPRPSPCGQRGTPGSAGRGGRR